MENTSERYTITKTIAKHGQSSVILIPKVLRDVLPPGTLVRLDIKILKKVSK